MEIRDELAIQRTILANERTLLAYSRTALTLVIPGVSFYGFSDSTMVQTIGIAFVPMGLAVLTFGILRFNKKKKQIREDRIT